MSIVIVGDQFLDRSEAKVDIEDRGYQFGDGVYEVVRVYDGNFYMLEEHIARLYKSASAIELSIPHSKGDLIVMLEELVKRNNLYTGCVYLQYTRGVAPRGHAFPVHSNAVLTANVIEKERPFELLQRGMNVITHEDVRWSLCHIKSLNLLGSVLANQKAKSQGKDEAILHRGETVTECSASNAYIVKNSVIYTHPANQYILNGITRQAVIHLAKENGYTVVEEAFTLDELKVADEVFATGTTTEVMPIVSVNNERVGDGKPGKITRNLQKYFNQSIEMITQTS